MCIIVYIFINNKHYNKTDFSKWNKYTTAKHKCEKSFIFMNITY